MHSKKRFSGPTTLVLTLLATALTAPVSAQVSVGVLGGFARTFMDATNLPTGLELQSRNTYQVGGIVELALNDDWSIALEPQFFSGGAVVSMSGVREGELETSYLDVPLMVRVELGEGSIRPFLIAGPSVGYLLSAIQRPVIGPTEDLEDDLRDLDYAVNFGAGVEFPLGTISRGFVRATYHHGLRDITETNSESVATRRFNAVVGLSFTIGG